MSERIRPFDTITSASGITYVSEQPADHRTHEFRAHASYVPVSLSERRILPNGSFQQKVLLDGFYGHAEDDHLKRMPSGLRDEIITGYRIHPATGERYIVVPTSTIDIVTDSRQALTKVLHGNSNAPLEVVESIGLAVDWITQESNIRPANIGIYGGAAAGIFRIDRRGPVDVDLTVLDLANANEVIQFCSSHQPEDITTLYQLKRAQQEARGMFIEHMKRKSPQHSAFPEKNHPLHGICYVDIWMVRRDDDYPTSPDVKEPNKYELQTHQGTVEDSRGSLALPAHYIFQSEDGRHLNILSPRFHFLASAQTGEKVGVTGLHVKGTDWMVLTDPQSHGFVYASD